MAPISQAAFFASAGRLGVPLKRAVGLIHAAGVGIVTILFALSGDERDPKLSPLARNAAFADDDPMQGR